MKRFALILVSSIIVSTVAVAQDTRMLTVEEAIATALRTNYDIALSKNDSMVAAIDYLYRNAAFLPTINGEANDIWNRNNQRLRFVKRVGGGDSLVNRDAVRTHNLNYSANLQWTLFDGLRMFATRKKAEEFLTLGSLTVKNQVINTVADVITTYYDVVRQKQQLRAVDEQIVLNEERVRLAQYKLDIGTGAKPDLLQSKVDLNAQKSLRLQQLALIEQLKDQLNQVMNLPARSRFEVADSIPLNQGIALADISEGIADSNPTLLIAQKNVDIARLTLKERKADRWPVVRFNSAYNFTQNDNSVAVNINQPIFNSNRGFNYGLSATIPIFNQFTVRRLIRQGELDIRYQQLVLDNQRTLVNLSVLNAYTSYEQQKQALALEEENIKLARENVDIVFQVYKLGAATLVQLREAQSSLEDANNRLIAARYSTKLAETELIRLKGDMVK
ncbi:MAG: TolC family protein [Chitinophagaceae bacterium]|nr:MAG: TolC family protein [Chitinophagaceae bacterium]